MKIEAHDIQSFRSVIRYLYIDAADRGGSALHTNYLRPRLRKFFPNAMIDECLRFLILLNELVHLGQGWYGPTKGYKFDQHELVISLFGTTPHPVFDNGSSGFSYIEEIENASLMSWLGPPFVQITHGKAIGLRSPYGTKEMCSGDEVYWTDSADQMPSSPNWISKSESKRKSSRLALSRQKGPFCFNYIQEDLNLKSSITPMQAYELMALKDILHGRPLPVTVFKLNENTYSVTPRRYHTISMKRLLALLSVSVKIEEKTTSYELSENAFTKFKLLAASFVEITTSRRI